MMTILTAFVVAAVLGGVLAWLIQWLSAGRRRHELESDWAVFEPFDDEEVGR